MSNTFRRHQTTISNGRPVRPGNDPLFITGYHLLWHGYALQGRVTEHDTDIAAAPLDAPDRIPAGSCTGHDMENGKRAACQTSIWFR